MFDILGSFSKLQAWLDGIEYGVVQFSQNYATNRFIINEQNMYRPQDFPGNVHSYIVPYHMSVLIGK